MISEFVEVVPDPERITESLRDTGYSLNAAIEDILDNSIAADADQVSIVFDMNPRGEVIFRIVDNGYGMNREGILNALTYGSSKRDDPASLGKFGLGLKTASTAFAKKIRVVSRTEISTIMAGVWDLDLVASQGWQIEISPQVPSREARLLDAVAGENKAGTIVHWQTIDRVMPRAYKDPAGNPARKAMNRLQDSLREHLAMVYQRFLDPADLRARTVTINLNGTEVKAWDPFEFGDVAVVDQSLPIAFEDGTSSAVQIKAYVLPRKADMIARLGPDAHESSRFKNEYQGIYVYRENRLIHGPDWLGMWTQEPHTTNFRVELSFDHVLDDAFQIDIKKSRILLNNHISNEVRALLGPPRRYAEEVYRNTNRDNVKENSNSEIHDPSNVVIGDKSSSIPRPQIESTDADAKTATISNAHGKVSVDYRISSNGEVFIEIVDELEDGLLYKPTYIDDNPGVLVSRTHPYYAKVYLPNKNSGVAIQGLDSLLWALASAEFRSLQNDLKHLFEDIRYDVSKALKRLVEDLPEPDEAEDV